MIRPLLATVAALCAAPVAAQEVPALGAPGSQQAVLVRGGATPAANGTPSNGQTLPQGWPGQAPVVAPDGPLSARERRNVAMATRWRQQACTPVQLADGTLEFTQGSCEITVVCAVLRTCAIALEPGEMVTDMPDVGDPRWQVQRRIVGAGRQRTIHAIVKPGNAALDTTLTIPTNRRLLSIRLVSRRSEYMPRVAIRDGSTTMRQEWGSEVARSRGAAIRSASPCDQTPVAPPTEFQIGGGGSWSSAPAWQPLQAYIVNLDGGQATCIEFPADIATHGAPALIAFDSAGTERIISARWSGRRYLVHGTPTRMAVVGPNFQQISIERKAR